jgi:hypothetical protein
VRQGAGLGQPVPADGRYHQPHTDETSRRASTVLHAIAITTRPVTTSSTDVTAGKAPAHGPGPLVDSAWHDKEI